MRFSLMVQRSILFLVMTLALVGAMQTAQATGLGKDVGDQLMHAAGPQGADYGQPVDPRYTVVIIIRVLLGLLGTVVFVYMVYAGFLWMTASGNSEQVEKAQGIIRNSVIGLIIIFSAYTITIAAFNIARGYPVGWGTGWAGFVNSWIQ